MQDTLLNIVYGKYGNALMSFLEVIFLLKVSLFIQFWGIHELRQNELKCSDSRYK